MISLGDIIRLKGGNDNWRVVDLHADTVDCEFAHPPEYIQPSENTFLLKDVELAPPQKIPRVINFTTRHSDANPIPIKIRKEMKGSRWSVTAVELFDE